LTDVSGFCFHLCTISPTHTSPDFWRKSFVMPLLLTWDIRG
jgi:hypothetical protein